MLFKSVVLGLTFHNLLVFGFLDKVYAQLYISKKTILKPAVHMSNSHITKFLDHYLSKNTNDFAVLITGCWGSGKTYFITQYMGGKKLVKTKNWLTDSKNKVVVYVSLFGAKSRNDIEKRIFEILHPFLKESTEDKLALSGLSIIKGLCSFFPFAKKAANNFCDALCHFNDELCKYLRNNKKGVVIIFDDVERADMPVPELLGYINEYVEHLNLPCILLADKERWDEANEKQKDPSTLHKLSSTQEKVIGKTFHIQTTIDDVLKNWFSDSTFIEKRLLKILKKNQSVIKDVVFRSSVNNYRALKHTLFDLEWFVNNTAIVKFLENDEFAQLFLSEFIALGYSIYIGKLKASEIGHSNALRRIKDETITPTTYDNFEGTFQGLTFLSSYSFNFSESWINTFRQFFQENIIKTSVVQNVVRQEVWFEGHDEYWLSKASDFFLLNNADGTEALNAFYTALRKRTILDAKKLYSLYYKLVFFASIGTLEESKIEFQQKILKYAEENAPKFKSYKMDSADYLVSYFGESGKNGQDDNEEFWEKLNAVFKPYQIKKDKEEQKNALEEFFRSFNITVQDILRLIKKIDWNKTQYEKFLSEFEKLNDVQEARQIFMQSFYGLSKYDEEGVAKKWCNNFYPIVKSLWNKYLNGPKPLKNSQLSIWYLLKGLEKVLGVTL